MNSIYIPQGTINSNYNDIEGGYGAADINVDPDFIDPGNENFTLYWASPCIDAGNPDSQYNDPDGTRADMGVFYFEQLDTLSAPTIGLIEFDGDSIFLDWHSVAGAIEYEVYSSDDPESGYVLDETGTYSGSSWSTSAVSSKK